MYNYKNYFQSLQILHLALMLGQAVFAIVAWFVRAEPNHDMYQIFTLVVPIALFGGVMLGNMLFKGNVNKAKAQTSLSEKLGTYKTAAIIRWALLEGPVMLSLVAFFITSGIIFLGVASIGFLLFTFLRPSTDAIINDLTLSEAEASELR